MSWITNNHKIFQTSYKKKINNFSHFIVQSQNKIHKYSNSLKFSEQFLNKINIISDLSIHYNNLNNIIDLKFITKIYKFFFNSILRFFDLYKYNFQNSYTI